MSRASLTETARASPGDYACYFIVLVPLGFARVLQNDRVYGILSVAESSKEESLMLFRSITTTSNDRSRPSIGRTPALLSRRALALILLLLFAPFRAAAQGDLESLVNDGVIQAPPTSPQALAALINRPDVLDLELAVTQAELILAVRLADVTETKIVHGGRDVQVTEQYRFEPVRVLKGIFARESLLLTGQDLGIYRFAGGSERLPRGQLMLVLLGRQGQNYFNCCAAPTLSQSIPRLEGKDDPLLPAVEALIGMTRLRDRVARVELLRDALKKASGRAVSPVLLALYRRALLAARAPGVTEAILPYLKSPTASTREVAARTTGAMLEADRTGQGPGRSEVAKAIVTGLETAGPDVAARVALIDALGSLAETAGKDPAALAWLKNGRASTTLAETAARLRAVARVMPSDQKESVVRAFETMPLDSLPDLQAGAGRALVKIDPKGAGPIISARLAAKHAAGLSVEQEIYLLASLPAQLATPELLKTWGRPLNMQESLAFAHACSVVADPRLVSAVSTLLDPRQMQIRYFAIEALRRIDNDEAASALWPHLDEEADLSRKLQLIAFLGRHGFKEGYAQAIEHLSQINLRDQAVEALGAVADPRAVPELRRIWQTSNDLSWNAAVIRALARLGQRDITPKLLDLARVPGDPLAPSALVGLGYLGSPEALPIVQEAIGSRSEALVIAATEAAARLLARPELKSEPIRDRLAALLADADASAIVRTAALEALVSLKDPRLVPTLSAVARDANIEGTPLLIQVEHELARRSKTPGTAKN
jgi:HEAT repeats